ncbi:MAG TPA: choice-of-anchor tandem repeat GloVer-containing protein [Verrucomicrobiae bacterium]
MTINAFGTPIFTNLYDFSPLIQTNAAGVNTNFDGGISKAGLVVSGNTLYGTTSSGGTNGTGTLFKINTDGSAFSVLHQFSDGGTPAASLVLSGNMLYGTAEYGGSNDAGSVFAIGVNGAGFTNLYNFTPLLNTTNSDGANPTAGFALAGSALYGTAYNGGTNGNGTIFRINTDGTGFTNLYNFSAFVNSNSLDDGTNSDGANPSAGLAFYAGTLYGTTEFGGSGGSGTVFAINTNGAAFTNLYGFSTIMNFTNSDGAYAVGGVTYLGGKLFGTTLAGGTNNSGTLFALNANGGSYTNLHVFGPTVSSTNMDGAGSATVLAVFNNTLYGTTQLGGSGGSGTLFSVSTNGSNFQNLYNFTRISSNPLLGTPTNIDGGYPQGSLVMSGGSFYGATSIAGTGGNGGVYVLSLGAIPLHIQSISNGVVLTWGNPAFSLLASTNAAGIYAVIPGAASPYTNSISSPREFFSLQAF